jgi:ribonucleoside-diphosphate reductase alpha chain
MNADETPLPILMREPEPSVRGGLARGEAEQRPGRRKSATHELMLAGHKTFITVGKRRDGSVMEVKIELHKEGAPFRGAADVIARLVSHALQHGVPIETVFDGLRASYFDPAGEVTGHPRITHADSLFDLVARVIEDEERQ